MPVPKGNTDTSRILARDQAYVAIKDAIFNGVLLPGERLDDGELQQWLGISSTPVRQALYALTLEGLVETAPQAYTRVVEPKAELAMDHLQAIGVLALGITRLTLPKLSDDDRHVLIALLEDVLESLRKHDIAGAITASDAYHRALIERCPNASLVQLAQHAGIALAYYVTIAYRSIEIDWDDNIEGYLELIEGFRNGSVDQVDRSISRIFHLSVNAPSLGG